MNNKKISIIFIIISFAILIGIGITFAYFTSNTDFENEFNTALYQTEATETFTSPQNWMPGDTTPKELTITNTGNVDVKARVCITEEWESANGDTLDNEVNGERIAILNLANTSDWTKKGNCYEYNDTLEPNDETSSFIESVAFNPLIEADIECTTSGNTQTCTSSGDGYDNATYYLTFTVETVQANMSNKLWVMYFENRENDGQITIGDELVIGTEHFYVVSSDIDKTVLLAKYNLLVGDIFSYNRDSAIRSYNKTLSTNDLGYGMQSSTAIGWKQLKNEENETQYIGIVGFSGTNYWDNQVCQYVNTIWNCAGSSAILSEYSQNGETYYSNPHNTNYPFIYRNNLNTTPPNIVYEDGYGYPQNNGYTIAYYIVPYVSKLIDLGAPTPIEGRLLSQEEAMELGCDVSNTTCKNSPATAPSWIYSTSYWLGSAFNINGPWSILSHGRFGSGSYIRDDSLGVRPVIEIPTSELNNI